MPYFPVDDGFHAHPKAHAASLAALGLWTLAGSWCNDQKTDGYVPQHMIPIMTRGQPELADELVAVGLWRRKGAGYRFHQFLEDGDGSHRNISRSEVVSLRAKKSTGGLIGNHRRWHEGRGVSDPECSLCQGKQASECRSESDRSTDGGTDSGPNPPTPPHPTNNPPTPQGGKSGSRRSSNYDYDNDPEFLRFWDAYPLKKAKPKALQAWKAARKRGVDAQLIIDAAAKFRDDPTRKPDYTAHPATWLNGERWADQPTTSAPPAGPRPFWEA